MKIFAEYQTDTLYQGRQPIYKASLSSELDEHQQLFYKIEGELGPYRYPIGFYRERSEAVLKYIEILEAILDAQEKEAEKRS